MTYEYLCTREECGKRFDVIKPARDMDVNEFCPRCESPAMRQFVPQAVYFSGTSVQNAEYNPAFGCVVKNKEHRAELAKRHGVVEIGNDFKSPKKIHKQFETERKAKREKAWEEL